MKLKFSLLIFSSIILTFSCKNKKNSQSNQEIEERIVDSKIASIYPLNSQYLELQNLQLVEKIEDNRNFKNTQALGNNLKTILYKKWCQDGDCYQLNTNYILEKTPQVNSNSIIANSTDINYIIPSKYGVVSVTSLANENISTIKHWDNQLSEKWNTIYEKSKLDSNGNNVQFAEVLGYNNELLVYHSSDSDIPKSGYILLKNGYKKQEESQWSAMLIDEDNTTVLGQVIQNANLSYSIRIGNTITNLPESVTGYTKCHSLVHGNKIFLGFYYPKTDIIKIITLDYQTGNILWENSISSAKIFNNILFSAFEDNFLIEIVTSTKNNLYVFQQENGKLMGKF